MLRKSTIKTKSKIYNMIYTSDKIIVQIHRLEGTKKIPIQSKKYQRNSNVTWFETDNDHIGYIF